MEKIKKVKAAVIGIGNMGKNHVRNYFEINKVNLVAIADLNEELGKELAEKFNCNYYSDFIQMLDEEKPDIVSVVVPSKFHHRVAKETLRRGIHTLVEKPIATTVEEAEDLINTAEKSGAKLMVGHIERFNPGVNRLKELIKAGDLGKITSVIARRVGVFPPQIKDANVLIDLAVHDIDILNYFFEVEPDKLECNGGRALIDSREDYAEIFLNYGDASGFIQVNWITPVKIRNLAVTGTKGYAELNYISQKLELHRSIYSKVQDNFGDFVIRFSEPEVIDIEVEQKEPLKAELTSFIDSVLHDKPIITSGRDGLRALKIALEGHKKIDRSEKC